MLQVDQASPTVQFAMKSYTWLALFNACALSTRASFVQAASLAAARPSHPALNADDDPFVAFKASFGSDMVLQQAPAKACVSGTVGNGGSAVTVTVAAAQQHDSYQVDANVSTGTSPGLFNWKACLEPTAASGANASSYTITAVCTQGCPQNTTAQIERVNFGEVWYCGGRTFLCALSNLLGVPRPDPTLLRFLLLSVCLVCSLFFIHFVSHA